MAHQQQENQTEPQRDIVLQSSVFAVERLQVTLRGAKRLFVTSFDTLEQFVFWEFSTMVDLSRFAISESPSASG